MKRLSREDLFSLEDYAEKREAFRHKVLAHKKDRQIRIGDHATLYFEDALTIQYQIQEMLRIEKIFERAGIDEELDAYNPLIPDGTNFKATFMIEYADAEERREALTRMVGIEDRVWVQVDGMDRIYAVADEDLERETAEKTSAVHFLRFELPADAIGRIGAGAAFGFGIDHPNYTAGNCPLPEQNRISLAADLKH